MVAASSWESWRREATFSADTEPASSRRRRMSWNIERTNTGSAAWNMSAAALALSSTCALDTSLPLSSLCCVSIFLLWTELLLRERSRDSRDVTVRLSSGLCQRPAIQPRLSARTRRSQPGRPAAAASWTRRALRTLRSREGPLVASRCHRRGPQRRRLPGSITALLRSHSRRGGQRPQWLGAEPPCASGVATATARQPPGSRRALKEHRATGDRSPTTAGTGVPSRPPPVRACRSRLSGACVLAESSSPLPLPLRHPSPDTSFFVGRFLLGDLEHPTKSLAPRPASAIGVITHFGPLNRALRRYSLSVNTQAFEPKGNRRARSGCG